MIPDLWREYERFCSIRRGASAAGVFDLSDLDWIFPTTLLPLGSFLLSSKMRYVPPRDQAVAGYISTMFSADTASGELLKSYVPLVRLPRRNGEEDRVLGLIYRFHDHGRSYGGENAFKYLIAEMVDNIYQHSRFSNAFVMAQRYEKKGFVEVAIIDDGITIGGSLRGAGMRVDDDVDAIARILREGISAKGSDTRGYGIRSNARMFTDGLKGVVLIVSGSGAVELAFTMPEGVVRQNNYHLSGGSSSLQGTLVSVRIPFPSERVNVHEYTA